ncbi:MAG TPA: acetolactate synthase [Candidatus Limiplasma sp.]|nr:acetolactate synthase [Candidatus Limiplasma sp.]
MFVKQISVFLENKSGSLAGFTKQLGEHGFDLMSLSIADTTDFGILRCIVADYERAKAILTEAGYSVKVTDVLAVSVADHPGALAEVLSALSNNDIGLEYLYSFFRNHGDHALIIIRVDQPEKAVNVLESEGVKMLSQEDLQAI